VQANNNSSDQGTSTEPTGYNIIDRNSQSNSRGNNPLSSLESKDYPGNHSKNTKVELNEQIRTLRASLDRQVDQNRSLE